MGTSKLISERHPKPQAEYNRSIIGRHSSAVDNGTIAAADQLPLDGIHVRVSTGFRLLDALL